MAGEENPFAKYVGTGAAPPPRKQPGPTVVPIPQFPDERRQQHKPRPVEVAPAPVKTQPQPVEQPAEENPFAKFVGKSAKPPSSEKADPLAGLDLSGDYPTVRQQIAGLPEQHRKTALDKWADAVVAKEREGAGAGTTAEDYWRRAAMGFVGGWGDRLGAKISSARGNDYDEALAYEQAKSRAAVKNTSTKVATLPVVGDVTTGDLAGLAGGIATAPLVPVAPVARAVPYLASAPASMAARALNTGATGAAVGGAVGYGSGNTDDERLANAQHGAMIGGAVGAAAPAVAQAIGNGAGRVAAATAGLPQNVAQYSRRAVDRMARDFEADNPANPGQYGAEGMLADMGPTLRGTTGAMRTIPGEHQGIIDQAITQRRQTAPDRINATMNAELGPAQNLVQLEEQVMGQARQNARPHYDQFYDTDIQPTPRMQQFIDFAERNGLVRAADEAMEREALATGQAPSPNMRLDFIKRQFDRLASWSQTPAAGMDRHAADQFKTLARSFREEVDRALSPNDPTQSAWAQARRASGEGLSFREGLEEGGSSFSKGTHPDQMAADLARVRGTPYEAGYVAGARGQIRDMMGNAAAAYGPNGDIAVLKNLNAPYAQQKMQTLVGPQPAARIGGRLNAEAAFNRTFDEVQRNSLTAQRLATKEGLPNPRANGGVDIPTNPTELAMGTVARIVDHLAGGVISARNQQMLREMAEMAVAQGAQRHQIVQGLRQYLRQGQVNARARPAIARIANIIMSGPTTAGPGNAEARRLAREAMTAH